MKVDQETTIEGRETDGTREAAPNGADFSDHIRWLEPLATDGALLLEDAAMRLEEALHVFERAATSHVETLRVAADELSSTAARIRRGSSHHLVLERMFVIDMGGELPNFDEVHEALTRALFHEALGRVRSVRHAGRLLGLSHTRMHDKLRRLEGLPARPSRSTARKEP